MCAKVQSQQATNEKSPPSVGKTTKGFIARGKGFALPLLGYTTKGSL